MHAIEVRGERIPLGPKGFMVEFSAWDEDIARAMAAEEGLELQDCHWKAIHFIRQYFDRFEIPPSPRVMIKEVGDQLHAYRCTYRTIKELFPGGGCKQACRLAGLPDYYCHAC
jgi:tRNA 2-thiouridine synthesizing protein E